MSLTAMLDMLKPARGGGYAVGAFEVWDMASIQAVIGAAEKLNQPVILQLGPFEIDYAGLDELSRLAIDHARKASVPVAVHLDHGDSLERVKACIERGFTSVMLDVSHLPFEENAAATKEVVRLAHARGITVEGELGRIGGEEAGINVTNSDVHLTDPDEAVRFVQETGVDVLAVAIGTAHGFYKEQPNIRLGLLKRIAEKVSVPLVLHGGSDVPGRIIKEAIGIGISKVNVCTELVAAFANAFFGEKSDEDFRYTVPGVYEKPRRAGRELVMKKIRLFAGL